MPSKYTVKSEDNLSKIAKAHGVTLGELLKVNPQFSQGSRDSSLICPGERINTPKPQFSKQEVANKAAKECTTKPKKFFIAVADRSVQNTLGAFYHYSVQYWQCDEDIPLRSEMSVEDISSAYPKAVKKNPLSFLEMQVGKSGDTIPLLFSAQKNLGS